MPATAVIAPGCPDAPRVKCRVGRDGCHPPHRAPLGPPEALEAAFSFSALDAIFTRRARRFALGADDDRPARLPLGEGAGPAGDRGGGDPRRRGHRHHRRRARGVAVHATADGETTSADKLASFTGTELPEPARDPRHRAVLDQRRRRVRPAAARRGPRALPPAPDPGGAQRALPAGDQAPGRAPRGSAPAPEPVQVQRVAGQHRGRDAVHPGVRRDAPVHLGHAPLLRPSARLLRRRQAARQRPAAPLSSTRGCSIPPIPSTCGTSSAGRWST